jgi:hypothetical protein
MMTMTTMAAHLDVNVVAADMNVVDYDRGAVE